MQENNSQSSSNLPNASEPFGKVPNVAESFGRLPHGSESYRIIPKPSERKENHTLTVREVARMFESAGVARTERSITNWCQENRSGIARLDAYFDPNERRYFITPQSVEQAIQEEKARMAKGEPSETFGTAQKPAETPQKPPGVASEADAGQVQEMAKEIMDLKITNRGKDFFIEQLQKEREGFVQERKGYVEQLMGFNRKVGELETKLLQLGAGGKGSEEPVSGDGMPKSAS